jgi:hypothetical protein
MLNNLKLLLGFTDEDEQRDTLLRLIIEQATARLLLLLGGVEEVPEKLEYILLEVAVARFNRIGSEGLTNHTVEGESLAFVADDFAAYTEDIKAYLNAQTANKVGKVCFI